jgi:hypothetical protein
MVTTQFRSLMESKSDSKLMLNELGKQKEATLDVVIVQSPNVVSGILSDVVLSSLNDCVLLINVGGSRGG